MGRVLYLLTFRVTEGHREVFLAQAKARLKPYWESHGVDRYEVYDEVGPTGPTGRIVQAFDFPNHEAYLKMQALEDPDMPREPYRWLFEPEYRVLDRILPDGEAK